MNFSCTQQDLISAVSTVQKSTSKKHSPFQQYIYIEATQYNVRLDCSTSDNTLICTLPAQIHEPGTVLVPTSIFRDIISKLPDVTVNIAVNEKCLMNVNYTNMKYSIQCMSASAYTFLDDIEGQIAFDVKTDELRRAVSQTYFTASLQETRPILTGIFFKCDNGSLDLVTTDGSRVSIKTLKLDNNESFEAIIPARFLHDALNSSFINAEITNIVINDKYMKLSMGNTTVITGVLSGKNINYKSIIPTDASTVMICNRNEFLNIIERAFLLADEDLYTVRFDVNYSKLFVSSNSVQGEAFEEIYVQTSGNPVTIALNSKSFIEILRNIDYEQLVFEFTTGTRICKIKPLEADDIIYLISPIRI